jgi:hypothetical protein
MKQILLVFFICTAQIVTAQDKSEVENAVRDYVEGFYYGDTFKIHRSISPDLIKHGYYRGKASDSYSLDTMSFRQCVDYAANVKKRGVNPKIESFPKKIEVFDVLDKTASAKLTAWWGTDYLLLSKNNGKWMITHVLWQSPLPEK